MPMKCLGNYKKSLLGTRMGPEGGSAYKDLAPDIS